MAAKLGKGSQKKKQYLVVYPAYVLLLLLFYPLDFLISSFKTPYIGDFGEIPLINHIFAVGESFLIERRIWTIRHNTKPQIENMNKTCVVGREMQICSLKGWIISPEERRVNYLRGPQI